MHALGRHFSQSESVVIYIYIYIYIYKYEVIPIIVYILIIIYHSTVQDKSTMHEFYNFYYVSKKTCSEP